MDIDYIRQVAFRSGVLDAAKDMYVHKNVNYPKDVAKLFRSWGGADKIELDMQTVIGYIRELDLLQLEVLRRAVGASYLRWVIINAISYRKEEPDEN